MPGPESGHEYDALMDPTAEVPTGSTEDAAVRSTDPELSPEEEAARDAALRERKPLPPLTEDQIQRLADMRGGVRPSDEDIEGINQARAAGIWHSPWGS